MNANANLIDLGKYQIAFHRDANSIITMEVHTKLESINRMQYTQIMMSVLHYMGSEGFFDGWLPQQLAIYDKFGQIVPIEKMTE